MDISLDALERALPRNESDQNQVLKKLVLTLRSKLSSTQDELKQAQFQLCNACNNKVSHNSNIQDPILKKDLAAALAKATSLQADYDALTAHFEKLRDGYKRVLEHVETQKFEVEDLRTRNAQLSLDQERSRSNQLKIEEMAQKLISMQQEKQLIEKDLAQHFAAALDSAGRLEILKKESSQKIQELVQQTSSLEKDNQRLKISQGNLNTQNQELRNELQKIYAITSVESISELADEIVSLKNQNIEKQKELQILADKIVNERIQFNSDMQNKIMEIRGENIGQVQIYQQSHENEIAKIKNIHQEEIENFTSELTKVHTEFVSEHEKYKQLIENKEKAERQLETEKQVYVKAKERAMHRYNHLADQLESINQIRDELEGRVQELQLEITNLQNQLVECKNQNKIYTNNYDDIFLRAGQQQQTSQQLDIIQIQNQQNNSLTKTIIDRLQNQQSIQNYQSKEINTLGSLQHPIVEQKHDQIQDIQKVEKKEEILQVQIVEDEEINLLEESKSDDFEPVLQTFEISYSDMQLNAKLEGQYSLFVGFFTKEFLSAPQNAKDDELIVEFDQDLIFKLPMIQETLNWLNNGNLILKLMKNSEDGLNPIETIKMPTQGLLNNQEISDELQFKVGSLNIQISKI
eukprot:EST49411.1 Hypothetical protein SS50377_10336 [Spironucleus salmonicida]